MHHEDAKRIWEGVCILEAVHLIEREDGKSELVLLWKEGGEKRFRQFLRRGAAEPRQGGKGGPEHD